MERKLELYEIAGYLPYGLMCISLKPTSKTIGERMIRYAGMGCVQIDSNDFEEKNSYILPLSKIKPILRPLSDLYCTITRNGKEITPIVELAKISGFKDCTDILKPNKHGEYIVLSSEGHFRFAYLSKKCAFAAQIGVFHKYTANNQYQLFDYMNELKIDYRNLIDTGLAIDCNTLETNPYK